MAAADTIEVQFWGVRGGIPCPGPTTARYGGNTACVEMRLGEHTVVADAGTGLRALGHALNKRAPVTVNLLFSHTTFDRISGIPFCSAAYNPANAFHIWAGHLPSGKSVKDILRNLMTDPVFPVPMEILNASLEFNDFGAGETLEPEPGLRIRTASLNHVVPVTGYRVEWNGRSICYVSDLIAGAGGDEGAALALLDGADLAIVNTADNAPGASDWRDAVRLCETAGVTTCATFSHLPDHDDAALDEIAVAAETLRPGTVVAREGMTLSV